MPPSSAAFESAATYAPVDTLKPVDREVWIVDGPMIRFGFGFLTMPFPTRMTLLHVGGGALLVHSPTPLTPSLRREIAAVGTPRWLIGPSRLHYGWLRDWKAAYPAAETYVAPGTAVGRDTRVDFTVRWLDRTEGFPWDGAVRTLPIAGRGFSEVEFFHVPSRTLVLTDLIENFERTRLPSRFAGWLTRLGAVQDPRGSMPRDMRLAFGGRRAALRAAVETMIGWRPAHVILAHGRWYATNGVGELRQAFAWLL